MKDLNLLVRKETAARTRRLLYWTQRSPETLPLNSIIKSVIENRLWSLWGYSQLATCLQHEFHLPTDKVIEWTKEAINKGYEDARIYGTGEDAE